MQTRGTELTQGRRKEEDKALTKEVRKQADTMTPRRRGKGPEGPELRYTEVQTEREKKDQGEQWGLNRGLTKKNTNEKKKKNGDKTKWSSSIRNAMVLVMTTLEHEKPGKIRQRNRRGEGELGGVKKKKNQAEFQHPRGKVEGKTWIKKRQHTRPTEMTGKRAAGDQGQTPKKTIQRRNGDLERKAQKKKDERTKKRGG